MEKTLKVTYSEVLEKKEEWFTFCLASCQSYAYFQGYVKKKTGEFDKGLIGILLCLKLMEYDVIMK